MSVADVQLSATISLETVDDDPELQGQADGSRLPRTVPERVSAGLFKVARRRLGYLDAADRLEVLTRPPGNRLEALEGNRAAQHSIRINDQFRICFKWTSAGPEDVEIVDYH